MQRLIDIASNNAALLRRLRVNDKHIAMAYACRDDLAFDPILARQLCDFAEGQREYLLSRMRENKAEALSLVNSERDAVAGSV